MPNIKIISINSTCFNANRLLADWERQVGRRSRVLCGEVLMTSHILNFLKDSSNFSRKWGTHQNKPSTLMRCMCFGNYAWFMWSHPQQFFFEHNHHINCGVPVFGWRNWEKQLDPAWLDVTHWCSGTEKLPVSAGEKYESFGFHIVLQRLWSPALSSCHFCGALICCQLEPNKLTIILITANNHIYVVSTLKLFTLW